MLQLNLVEPVPVELDRQSLAQLVQVLANWRPQLAGQINVKLVDDAEIKSLNKAYGGQDEATDVLSFPYPLTPGSDELGDIAISYQAAARQAETAAHSLSDEIAILALHGCLHLLGEDHHTPAAAARMERLQQTLAAAANLTYRKYLGNN